MKLSEYLKSRETKVWRLEDSLTVQNMVREDIAAFAKAVKGAAAQTLAVIEGIKFPQWKTCGILFERGGLMLACFKPEGHDGPCSTDEEPL